PLAAFIGKSGYTVNGTWALQATDSQIGNVGTINNWALMIDEVPGTRVTFSGRLTEESFLAAGYTPTAAEQLKLTTTFYSIATILNGQTDRLADDHYCGECHNSFDYQNAPVYYPNVGDLLNLNPITPMTAHWRNSGYNTTYSWGDPTPNGLVAHFRAAFGGGKPEALRAIFQKWLDDGALP
ncbi:MAG: hypothetical protein C5B54_11025, partial [Acidobacteria bacterium]